MAYIINFKEFIDSRGSLLPINGVKQLPFEIKRIFYIYNVPNENIIRGGHRHKITTQALIAVAGSCVINNNDSKTKESFLLDQPAKCLILEPKDWHTMEKFSNNCILMVLSSSEYDASDYIDEPYIN